MNPIELSEWFYWKSCYYHGVEKLNKYSPSYIRAWIKFMSLAFWDWIKTDRPTTKEGK